MLKGYNYQIHISFLELKVNCTWTTPYVYIIYITNQQEILQQGTEYNLGLKFKLIVHGHIFRCPPPPLKKKGSS